MKLIFHKGFYKIEKESFSRFLDDIQNFTELKNMNKLNIFKSKI